ncbi:MAG: hypothetical protein ACYC1Q_01035 [Bacteroidia bacterium]
MKTNKFLLILLSLSLAISSCKKDEDPAPDTSLPAGNYIKFQGVTYLENQWVAAESWIELGNRPTMKISLNTNKTKAFLIAFQDAPVEKTYKFSSDYDGTNNAPAAFRENSTQGEQYYPDDNANGTVTVKMVNGQKVIEVHGTMAASSPGGVAGGQFDARFIWVD